MLDAAPAPLVQVRDLKMHFPIYTDFAALRAWMGRVESEPGFVPIEWKPEPVEPILAATLAPPE